MRLAVIIIICLVGNAQAAIYQCRDEQGRRYFSDRPRGLPEDCREQRQLLNPAGENTFNLVPQQAKPVGSGAEFEQQVQEMEQQLQRQQEQAARLLQQARSQAQNYQQAEREKRQALRSWSYNSREQIKAADERIAEARKAKQQLLDELAAHSIPQQKATEIRGWLEQIEP